jgi:hypothetical protein
MRLESDCDHSGSHSPRAKYERGREEIRYLTVCDSCGSEIREVHRERYVPDYNPAGNNPYVAGPRARAI